MLVLLSPATSGRKVMGIICKQTKVRLKLSAMHLVQYLDLLFALQENNLSTLFSETQKRDIEHLVNIAGGSKYQPDLMDLLS